MSRHPYFRPESVSHGKHSAQSRLVSRFIFVFPLREASIQLTVSQASMIIRLIRGRFAMARSLIVRIIWQNIYQAHASQSIFPLSLNKHPVFAVTSSLFPLLS